MITDPYFSINRGADRLLEQYKLHGSLVVAFDFDDTIYDYHKKGFTYPKVVSLLLECQELGMTLIMLTTTEDENHYKENLAYCKSLGLDVKYVNTGPVMPKARKPFFNVYLDDKAGLRQAYDMLNHVVQVIKKQGEMK